MPEHQRSRPGLCASLGLAMALGLASEAGAVLTVTTGYTGTRTLTLQIGTATTGAVDTVQFNVGSTPAGNSQATAVPVNGNGTAVVASSGAVVFRMSMSVPSSQVPQPMTTTVNSPVALTCVAAGGCGGASIPFSAISWTVSPLPSGEYAAFDLQNGTFTGGSTQQLLSFSLINAAGIAEVQSSMTFRYANTTAYPAGTYSGTVTYTASLP